MTQEDDGTSKQVMKSQEVFWDFHLMGTRQHITWYRNGPFDLNAQYTNSGESLGTYKINLPQLDTKKKIKIEAKMNIHGIFNISSAHIADTEEVEEIVKEKREIKSDEETAKAAEEGEGNEVKKSENGDDDVPM